jgi:hypothetical protein
MSDMALLPVFHLIWPHLEVCLSLRHLVGGSAGPSADFGWSHSGISSRYGAKHDA